MVKLRIAFVALATAITIAGCTKIYTDRSPLAPSVVPTTTPTPTPASSSTTIEFRAIGNPTAVRVRYSTPDDGVVQAVTALPYESTVTTSADAVFLSLEATPLAFPASATSPFFTVQIVINGSVFRQATAADLFMSTLAVSGTWRR